MQGLVEWFDDELNEDGLCEDFEYHEEEQDADELDSMLGEYEGDW